MVVRESKSCNHVLLSRILNQNRLVLHSGHSMNTITFGYICNCFYPPLISRNVNVIAFCVGLPICEFCVYFFFLFSTFIFNQNRLVLHSGNSINNSSLGSICSSLIAINCEESKWKSCVGFSIKFSFCFFFLLAESFLLVGRKFSFPENILLVSHYKS